MRTLQRRLSALEARRSSAMRLLIVPIVLETGEVLGPGEFVRPHDPNGSIDYRMAVRVVAPSDDEGDAALS